jgi:hypothetical protein
VSISGTDIAYTNTAMPGVADVGGAIDGLEENIVAVNEGLEGLTATQVAYTNTDMPGVADVGGALDEIETSKANVLNQSSTVFLPPGVKTKALTIHVSNYTLSAMVIATFRYVTEFNSSVSLMHNRASGPPVMQQIYAIPSKSTRMSMTCEIDNIVSTGNYDIVIYAKLASTSTSSAYVAISVIGQVCGV